MPALPFGNKKCDTPTRLADSMLEGIRQFAPDALFTISSGDVVDRKFNFISFPCGMLIINRILDTNWVKTPE